MAEYEEAWTPDTLIGEVVADREKVICEIADGRTC
jgi:hypothetical protein